MRLIVLLAAVLVLASSGCGDDTGGGLPLGPSDDPAADACAQSTQDGDPVMAQTDRASVDMTVLGAAPSPYLIQLPDGAPGFIALNVPEAHHDWAFFTRPDVEVTSFTSADGTDLPALTPANNGACDGAGIVDYRFHRHEAGHVIVEFSAEGFRSIWLMFLQADSEGHGDGGMHHEDGGMHHEDGGMHSEDSGMHSEDGGMHSEDGGMHSEDGGMHSEDGGMHPEDGGA